MTDIGRRIKEKREAIGMTQGELAQKLGYKNKSTIGKIETGVNDIVLSKVGEFANALQTSVAYLMGWEYNVDTSKNTFDVSTLEKEIIIKYRQADSTSRAIVHRALYIDEESFSGKEGTT